MTKICPWDEEVSLDREPSRFLRLDLREICGESEEFRTGFVRLAWREGALYVHADLDDDDPRSEATGDHQLMWKLGDVFEMFLRDLSEERYRELHVTPNGHRFQLSFPRPGMSYRECIVYEPLFDFRVIHRAGGWQVAARVPWPVDRPALFSFSRYDCPRGLESPVLSSTSAHALPSFHRQEEWTRIEFGPSGPRSVSA
jgi:hypothetical protein